MNLASVSAASSSNRKPAWRNNSTSKAIGGERSRDAYPLLDRGDDERRFTELEPLAEKRRDNVTERCGVLVEPYGVEVIRALWRGLGHGDTMVPRPCDV